MIISAHKNIGMAGYFRLQTRKTDGSISKDTGWFRNTLLYSGLNVLATRSDWMNYCQVGTGTTFPADIEARRNETSLENHFAGTSTIVANSTVWGQAAEPPYYGWKRKTFRFPAGSVAANLSEVGVGWGTTGSTLISRAQILDPISGNPTTITPLADEILDVTYELRYYVPTEDVVGPVLTLGGQTYNTLTRAADATSDYWSERIGSAIAHHSDNDAGWFASDGNIGTVLTNPGGNTLGIDASRLSTGGYTNNSYQVQVNVSAQAAEWNLANGIRSVRIVTTAGNYQTQFSNTFGGATIPKNDVQTMTLSFILSWGHYE